MAKCVRHIETGTILRLSNDEAEKLMEEGKHTYTTQGKYRRWLNKIDRAAKQPRKWRFSRGK